MRPGLLMAALLAPAAVHAQAMQAGDAKWGPAPPSFPRGAEMAVLAGDPGKPGLFVVRLKMPAGYRMPAHHHPSDEMVTVISGSFALGMGDALDPAKTLTLLPGGFARAPVGMNHFAFAATATVVEIAAEGPFAMTYVNPADDPSARP